MGYVIPVGYSQIVWRMFSGNGDGQINVQLGFENADVVDQSNADAASQEWADEVAAQLNTGIRFTGVTLTVGNDGDPLIFDSDVGAPEDGARGGNPWPLQCCFLVRKSSGLGGRKNRGRMYLPGGIVDDFEGGGLLSSSGASFANGLISDIASSAMLTALGGSGWVILHTGVSEDLPTPITSFSVENKLATQRGRLR